MTGYDFDKTILHGNSVQRFSWYCFVRLPYLWLLLPELLLAFLLYGLHIIRKEAFLFMLEVFIVFVPHREKFVKRFWDKNIKHIKKWYLDVKKDDDIIISASPTYIVEEACNRLGVRCITSVSGKNGAVRGKHCYGKVKVERYREQFGDTPLVAYYSDSLSDKPMFKLAQKGYLVRGEKIRLVYENGEKVTK